MASKIKGSEQMRKLDGGKGLLTPDGGERSEIMSGQEVYKQ